LVVAALTRSGRGFDRLSRVYRPLEFLAFGGDLERARFRYLGALAGARRILILGEGDGRFLSRLLGTAPGARVDCIDSSPAMTARAAARAEAAGGSDRVCFVQSGVLEACLPPSAYDAVVTLFFLDCFTADQVTAIVGAVRPSMAEGARWIYADFALPAAGFRRWRARLWLGLLYRFFGWTTGLKTRELPPSEEILLALGFRRSSEETLQGGLLRAAVFDSPAVRTGL
jgi:SAM-dependent methyltransferase